MRIRRNAKASVVLSTAENRRFSAAVEAPEAHLQPHSCRFNQSPWEQQPHRDEEERSWNSNIQASFVDYKGFTRNDSRITTTSDTKKIKNNGDSVGDDERLKNDNDEKVTKTTVKLAKTKKKKKRVRKVMTDEDDDDENDSINAIVKSMKKKKKKRNKNKGKRKPKQRKLSGNDANDNDSKSVIRLCQKNDGKGWHCKKEAKSGFNLCEHHWSQFRSYHGGNGNPNSAPQVVANYGSTTCPPEVPPPTRRKAKRPGSDNPSEFYYYSGFGPRWGKKRGGGGGDGNAGGEQSPAEENCCGGSRGLAEFAGVEVDDDDGDDEDENDDDDDYDDDDDMDPGGGGEDCNRKRVRRPVKARSLKSLM